MCRYGWMSMIPSSWSGKTNVLYNTIISDEDRLDKLAHITDCF
jgi:hypothetical protein